MGPEAGNKGVCVCVCVCVLNLSECRLGKKGEEGKGHCTRVEKPTRHPHNTMTGWRRWRRRGGEGFVQNSQGMPLTLHSVYKAALN